MAVTSDGADALRPTILVVEDDGAVRNLTNFSSRVFVIIWTRSSPSTRSP